MWVWLNVVYLVSFEINVRLFMGWRLGKMILVFGFFSFGWILVCFYLFVKYLDWSDRFIILVSIGSKILRYLIIRVVGIGFSE